MGAHHPAVPKPPPPALSIPQHPPASAPAPRAAAGNTVPCYRKRSGTEPGLSRSPRQGLSPRGEPGRRGPPPGDSPAWGRQARGLLGGARSQAAGPWAGSRCGAGGTLPARGAGAAVIQWVARGQAASAPGQPLLPPPRCPPPPWAHTFLFLRGRAIDLLGHRDLGAVRRGGHTLALNPFPMDPHWWAGGALRVPVPSILPPRQQPPPRPAVGVRGGKAQPEKRGSQHQHPGGVT